MKADEALADRPVPCALRQALIVVLVGAAVGLAANGLSPRRIPVLTPPKAPPHAADVVTLQDAQALWNSGTALFLDARAPADYQAGHIAGALSLPIDDFDDYYLKVQPLLTPDAAIVAYCDGMDCDLSHRLMDRLREFGFHNVKLLVNGWTAWHTAGLLTHAGAQP